MILSGEKINELSLEYLEKRYTVTATDTESVIDRLIFLDEQLQTYSFYNDNKNIIRQFIAKKLFDVLEVNTPDKDSAGYLVFSRKVEAFFFCYKLFLNVSEIDFEEIELYEKIIKCKQQAKARKDYSYLPEVIVSMTTFPGRIDTVYKALNSVFIQSFKPDRVILWLAEEQFPDKQLPQSLTDYIPLGLEIRWCKEDLRSHKKYYYVMQEYPKAIVITVDDDLIYDQQLVEALITSYLHFPDAVSAARTHLMKMDDDGKIAPYMQWGNEFSGILGHPTMQLFATSGGGTLFPPDCMDKELFNMENIRLLAPNADDLWFKIMQVKKGTPVVLVKRNEKLAYVPGSQAIGLRHDNMGNHGNDIQLAKLLEVYDNDGRLLKMIFEDNYTTDSNVIGVDIFTGNDYGLLDSVGSYIRTAEKNRKENELLKKQNSQLSSYCDELKRSTDENFIKEYNKYKKESERLGVKCSSLERTNNKLSSEIAGIKNSLSFRIGRFITLIPRKIRGGIRCVKDNGIIYTIKHIFKRI